MLTINEAVADSLRIPRPPFLREGHGWATMRPDDYLDARLSISPEERSRWLGWEKESAVRYVGRDKSPSGEPMVYLCLEEVKNAVIESRPCPEVTPAH